jgi:hypothetical protein
MAGLCAVSFALEDEPASPARPAAVNLTVVKFRALENLAGGTPYTDAKPGSYLTDRQIDAAVAFRQLVRARAAARLKRGGHRSVRGRGASAPCSLVAGIGARRQHLAAWEDSLGLRLAPHARFPADWVPGRRNAGR